MQLFIQKFLEKNTFKQLQEKHGVYPSFSKSGHKFCLNYDQLESKEDDELANDCRGLILSANDGRSFLKQAIQINGKFNYESVIPGETKILNFPMRRFFNYGQNKNSNINWDDKNLSILQKLDGTLCCVYFDNFTKKWCVSTRSSSEADIPLDNGLFTFRTLFEKCLKESSNLNFEELTLCLDKDINYCFELTSPYNRVIVSYKDCKVTLLAARSRINLNEININKLILPKTLNIVHRYDNQNINDLLKWIEGTNPLDHEGVVVTDSNFNRIKIKSSSYVLFHKCRDVMSSSERNCMEAILLEKDDDLISFLPEDIVLNLNKLKSGLNKLIEEYDYLYKIIKSEADNISLGDKKTFANIINNNYKDYWTAPFFNFYSKKSLNMKDFILNNKKENTWSKIFLDKLIEISKK